VLQNNGIGYRCWCLAIMALLFGSHRAHAQQKPLHIFFADSMGNALSAVSVKVQTIPRNMIVKLQHSGDSTSMALMLPLGRSDSMRLSFSAAAYRSVVREYAILDTLPIYDTILLPYANSTLPDATVLGPPMMKRGDTTFYRVDAFKSGEEQKLGELIEKLPDFRYSNDGSLLFKGKPVEKIMIDGNEVFADKVQLMLNSFPVHVLAQVQALENQSNEKLLKGLRDGNSVYLNLKLNNAALQLAFGDMMVGGGLPDRYQVSPTVFALRNKVKLGYIANVNNLGEGFGWKAQQELKTEPQRGAENWLMSEVQLQTINNFDSRYYVRNRLFDQRLQLNAPLSPKLMMKQELSYTMDRQHQQVTGGINMLSADTFVSRLDTTDLLIRPRIMVSSTHLGWLPNNHSEWKGSFLFGMNNTSSQSMQQYYFNKDSVAAYNANYDHKWRQFIGMLEYTNRMSAAKAIKWWMVGASIRMPQYGRAVSADFPSLYQLPDNALQVQILEPSLRYKAVKAGAEYLVRRNKKLHTYLLNGSMEEFDFSSASYFTDDDVHSIFPFPTLSANVRQSLMQWQLSTSRGIKRKNTMYNFSGKLGAQALRQIYYTHNEGWNLKPTADLSAMSQTKFKKVATNWTLGYQQQYATAQKMYEGILPASFSMMRQSQGYMSSPMQTLNNTMSVSFSYPRSHLHMFMLMGRRQFRSPVFTNRVEGFLQLSADSLVNRPTNYLSFMYNYNYNNFKHRYYVSLSAGYNLSNMLYWTNHEIVSASSALGYIHLQIQKQLEKKFMVFGKANFSQQRQNYPYAGQKTLRIIDYWNWLGRLSYNPTKFININGAMEGFQNNIRNGRSSGTSILELEAQYKPEKKKWKLLLTCRNLTNAKYYGDAALETFGQYYSQIPLINRNFVMTAIWNF